MEKDLIQAKKYLSEQGYGNGTNYTTNLVAVLLANYAASHPPAAPVSGEELTAFLECVTNERNEFCGFINSLLWDSGLRTKCESLLIIYDQMRERLSATLPTREQEAKDKKSNKTVEICTRSIGGDVYVNYRREFGSDEANHLMKLVDDNIAKYGDESNYFYRIV